jgi:hypothetical protein
MSVQVVRLTSLSPKTEFFFFLVFSEEEEASGRFNDVAILCESREIRETGRE